MSQSLDIQNTECTDVLDLPSNPSLELRTNEQTSISPGVPAYSNTEMSARPQSFFESFFNAFIQEKNIRWMLIVGAATIFGSSLMLVTREWSHWSPSLQFATIVIYTTLLYCFAELGRHRLGLKATSNVLYCLVILLFPIAFHALPWLATRSFSLDPWQFAKLALLAIPAAAMMILASIRILDYWLRGREIWVVVSYVVLSLAGLLPVAESFMEASVIAAGAWALLIVGVQSLSGRLFWMLEEHRRPKILGFVPTVALGTQWCVVVVTKAGGMIPVEWHGFGLVALAATLVLPLNTQAKITERRTGSLPTPLPWYMLAPLLVGVTLTLAGVVLSLYRFSFVGPTTMAVVPTALVASAMMMTVARRTRQESIVWISLGLLAIAYQTSPVLVSDLIALTKQKAAVIVQEDRLPIAFYGLTYLPLILGLTLAFRYSYQPKSDFLRRPLKAFTTLLTGVLCVLALTHEKAAFAVSLVNVGLFAVLANTYRDRRYVVVTGLAIVVVASLWIPFGVSMHWFNLPIVFSVASLALTACFLITNPWLDRWADAIPFSGSNEVLNSERTQSPDWFLFRCMGYALVCSLFGIAVCFFVTRWDSTIDFSERSTLAVIAISLLVATKYSRFQSFGLATWILVFVGIAHQLYQATGDLIEFMDWSSWLVLGVSVASYVLTILVPSSKFSPLWRPLYGLSFGLSLAAIAGIHLPMMLASNTVMCPYSLWLSGTTLLAWCLVLSSISQLVTAQVALSGILPFATSAVLIHLFPNDLRPAQFPLIWSLAAAAYGIVVSNYQTRSMVAARIATTCWLAAMFLLSQGFMSWSMRCTSLVALGAIVYTYRSYGNAFLRSVVLFLMYFQVFLVVGRLTGAEESFSSLSNPSVLMSALPWWLVALAVGILVFDRRWKGLDEQMLAGAAILVRIVFLFGLILAAYRALATTVFSPIAIAAVGLATLTFAFAELYAAKRTQSEFRIWTTMVLLMASIGWFVLTNTLSIGTGVSQFLIVAVAIAALVTEWRITTESPWHVASRPLRLAGLSLPGKVTLLAIFHAVTDSFSSLSGVDELVLFSATGIYFFYGFLRNQPALIALSVFLFNIDLTLVWFSWSVDDLQVYLVPLGLSILAVVELLKRYTPVESKNPVRCLGTLTILVSPVADIVQGSWWHMVSLMLLSMLVLLIGIGIRVRIVVYSGTAFLIGDLLSMIVRGTIDHPGLLWIHGLACGVGIILLAAYCESYRERILQRIRFLSAELATWQ